MASYLDPNHWHTSQLIDELTQSAQEMRAMQVISTLKPTLYKDGNQWCYLLGDNLQTGVAGFGDTPALAMYDFQKAFWNEKILTH